ncbi:MAG: isochorismatase family protein [Clostridia bacterium]|nr:isochorismatase family protein [Clostridia bacterium]
MDSARTAFICVDMQIDFCGEGGYVDVMGYDMTRKPGTTTNAIEPIKRTLAAVRGTDINIIHTREGHEPDLSDAPFNKILRSKIIGDTVYVSIENPVSGKVTIRRGVPQTDKADKSRHGFGFRSMKRAAAKYGDDNLTVSVKDGVFTLQMALRFEQPEQTAADA